MKAIIIFFLALAGFSENLLAQLPAATYRRELPELTISRDVSLHFISPEPITYVDISSARLAGDLPVPNLLRLKLLPDTGAVSVPEGEEAVVTIVGESFIAQYALCISGSGGQPGSRPVQVNVLPEHTRPLDVAGITLTTGEMKQKANQILSQPDNKSIRKTKAYGMHAKLNHVYTAGDLIFLDITFSNRTELPYQIDELRFKIQDLKITKATNVQSVEIRPVWQLYPNGRFRSRYRNVYVFQKMTYPGNKVLNLEMSEKQLSGRTISLQVKYGDILEADKL